MYLIDSIGFGSPQSAVTLYIYREGRSCPDGVETLVNLVLKYNSNSDFIAQNWSYHHVIWSDRSSRGADIPEAIYLSFGLQIGRSTYES